ncbi:MAG: flagellar assembly protein FliW [Desulfobacteraceae bacterium]|nr:flagellar assembly protein FliW [Desulfobacteraceae bacterium]
MRVTTTRFGELELEDSKVIDMPDGMVGFSERRFFILNPENGGPFCWFQAVDNPDLAFVVIDPVRFFPEYQVRLSREEYDKLRIEPGDETLLLCVATMAADPHKITINLQGPIVVNPAGMLARQVVLDGNHTSRQPLFTPREPAATGGIRKVTPLLAVDRFPSLYCGMDSASACV